ncbi:biotin-dependent carboxyltransferase family protein (plasmid) [Sinorhizobium numidicum]|uniref:Biotin-dependent carboxyltransferase family protein n=1 Tax=Sinorhizobium numidicum TaxID=680248 RepID=A0ABY8D458_9HYPH|nr:biotin-dependent carboxyltransferase family protein [Sinorhizobium numidicum]WEX79393.1 biotin-dependent carboxyltransferase family protein [Sinorhizobium numidicum]WEX85650.1 biotin-dependent carboxyltransferase family protein [Sinorhizobium numidicum]
MIEVLQTGPLNTVQDLGRFGFRNAGVTSSGAMDRLALVVGNLLVGNDEGEAALEVQTFPFRLRFDRDMTIAITGADGDARLDGRRLPPWWAIPVSSGQVLELETPRRSARTYLSLAGGIDVEPVLGSRSTSLRGGFGGLEGRFLAANDRLAIGSARACAVPPGGFGAVPPEAALAEHFPAPEDDTLLVRAIPAGEYALFAAEAERFWTQTWKISSQSDRTGYRLSGEPIRLASPVELRSHGVVPGVVQMPPSGEPIIQMSDANTAGGYPKIAGVIDVDLWRLGQARIGSGIRFVQSSVAEALAAERAVQAYLDDIRRTVPMLSQALAAMSRR